ncbi:uncharacterized protein CLUP02_17881 [Colletotrichum lupini]|uniref:Uncharacterized protein n=1 Tax=Colletotrichum lupini TaxID=145971 RepID=A0A9Q8SFX7_9PEZI|nr:uncharacterized protein CLUP02_17881 [Colletotrichum lupini]UQC76368.1 hypothetical protein CLUP02_17881 [Colletotrichum lupini]
MYESRLNETSTFINICRPMCFPESEAAMGTGLSTIQWTKMAPVFLTNNKHAISIIGKPPPPAPS